MPLEISYLREYRETSTFDKSFRNRIFVNPTRRLDEAWFNKLSILFYYFKNDESGMGERAQQLKYLLCKPDMLNSIPEKGCLPRKGQKGRTKYRAVLWSLHMCHDTRTPSLIALYLRYIKCGTKEMSQLKVFVTQARGDSLDPRN